MADASPRFSKYLELVYQYFGERLAPADGEGPKDRHLVELAEYCAQLDSVRALVRQAEESSARGQSGPLDLDDVIHRGRERMAANGIAD